jgi:drug/metabolite transporter (DMT)-like permease
MTHESKGLLLGFVGVVIFSATLPFTRMAVGTPEVPQLSPWFVALGRAAVAGCLAAIVLLLAKAPRPSRAQLPWLAATAAGVVFGFPVLTTLAMRYVPSSHGAVIAGILPLATAAFGALLNRDRPSFGFWICAVVGSFVVVAFALRQGGGSLHLADWALLLAMVAAPLGYATGARLSAPAQGLGGGVNVICWVLVLSLPITLPISLLLLPTSVEAISARAWWGFAYVSVFSMFIGFFAWYRGLALGGVPRVSQVQLLQPFMTILLGVPLLGEKLTGDVLAFALVVVALVFVGKRMPVAPSSVR